MMMLPTSHLSDAQLVEATKRILCTERTAAVEIVVHLAEIEVRKIHLAAGFHCLRDYCIQELQLSEYEAFNRIEASRAGRAFPRIFRMLADGSLTLTTVQLLARKLTPENEENLLTAAAGLTKEQVQELLARHFPRPEVPSTVRKLPTPRSMAGTDARQSGVSDPPATSLTAENPSSSARRAIPPTLLVAIGPSSQRAVVTPLAPDRYKVTFTADAETCELLELAKDMLSHALPSGDTAQVVKRALKTLVDDLARRKFAVTDRPRASRGPADDQDIPAAVKREVYVRDGGRCRFRSTDGRRCGSRRFTQFHHVISRANGGKATAANIELRCGPHNRYEDDLETGAIQRRLVEGDITGNTAGGVTRSGTSGPPAHIGSHAAAVGPPGP